MRLWILCVHARSVQSWLTLCDPVDYSPPGSSVHRIVQARMLEWTAISSSRGSSQRRVSPTSLASPTRAGRFFTASESSQHRDQPHISRISYTGGQVLYRQWKFPTQGQPHISRTSYTGRQVLYHQWKTTDIIFDFTSLSCAYQILCVLKKKRFVAILCCQQTVSIFQQ